MGRVKIKNMENNSQNYYITKIEEIHKIVGKIEQKVSIFKVQTPLNPSLKEVEPTSHGHTVLGMALKELLVRVSNLEEEIA